MLDIEQSLHATLQAWSRGVLVPKQPFPAVVSPRLPTFALTRTLKQQADKQQAAEGRSHL